MSTTQALKAAATGQQPTEARSPYEALKRQLEGSKAEFLPLLGQSQQNVDRFVRVVLNAVLANPDLLEADRRSLINACMKAAQDGLMPDGREAVLNIYNTNVAKKGQPADWRKMAQYLPMVGGLVKKLYESGEVTYIDAACVYANDKFTYRRGDDPKLEHEPTMTDDPGPVIAAYAVIKLKNGEVKREVMPRRDIEAVRNASKAKESGPWVTWFDQQAIKSVIKRAYKQLPKADAFEAIAEHDNQALGYAAINPGLAEVVRAAPPPAIENKPAGETIEIPIQQAQAEPAAAAGDPQDEELRGVEKRAAQQQAPKITFAKVADQLNAAKDIDLLDAAADLIGEVGDAKQREELTAIYQGRRKELAGE